LKSQLADIGR